MDDLNKAILAILSQGKIASEIQQSPWYTQYQQHYGEKPDMQTKDYDYFGAWNQGMRPEKQEDHAFFNPVTKQQDQEYRWSNAFKRGEYLDEQGKPMHDKRKAE